MKQCGFTDGAVVETPIAATDGDTTTADMVYFDSLSGEREIFAVSVVTVGSDTSLARTSQSWTVSRRYCGHENKRSAAIASLEDNKRSGKQHHFTPVIFFCLWGDGPFDGGLPEGCLHTGESGRPPSDMKYTWSTMVASSFWDMRLSVACTATDAEFQDRRIIICDHTMNLPVVARQPRRLRP